MKKVACIATALALLGTAGLAATLAGDDDAPSVKDVMTKLHKGANSPLAQVKKELRASNPNWKVIQTRAKDFTTLGSTLAKNDPPKGDKAHFKGLADAYYDNAKELDAAAKKED